MMRMMRKIVNLLCLLKLQQNYQRNMDSITEQRLRFSLAKPQRNKKAQQFKDGNIFQSMRSTEPLPQLKRIRGKSYDFVGGHDFREKYIQVEEKKERKQEKQQQDENYGNQNYMTNSLMNSTINRNTIMSKMTKEQTNLLTKQIRQINRYKQYQEFWDRQSVKLKKRTLRGVREQTLLQNNVKGVYVHPNHDRMDVINTFVVHMWEMSLRNNNKILKRHIAGNKFNPVQLEEMLQTDRGTKIVESSIPQLPIQKLKNVKKEELCLSGRNKAFSETIRTRGASTQRLSVGKTTNQEEVYKISYTGNVKWMSTQGL